MEIIPNTDIELAEELHAITTLNESGEERYVIAEGDPLCRLGEKGKAHMIMMAQALAGSTGREFQVKSYRANIVTARAGGMPRGSYMSTAG